MQLFILIFIFKVIFPRDVTTCLVVLGEPPSSFVFLVPL